MNRSTGFVPGRGVAMQTVVVQAMGAEWEQRGVLNCAQRR